MKIGISLSGGGARGIAHIGVLKALEENGIFPDVIAGASAGAIVGAFYANGMPPEEILKIVSKSSLFKIFSFGFPSGGLTKLTYLKRLLKQHLAVDNFEDLQKQLFVAISNLNTGQTEVVGSGQLYDVIVASASIPLVFQPVEINGQMYVDGGLLNNMPVKDLRKKTDVVIGVNVMPDVAIETEAIQSTIAIATRCFQLSVISNTRPNLKFCDLVINPEKVHAYNVFQFNKYQEIYEIGYEAAMKEIGPIQALVNSLQ